MEALAICNFPLDFPKGLSTDCPSCCQEILIFTGSRSKYTYPAAGDGKFSQLHSMRYLPAVGLPTPSRSTFSAVISSRGERDRSFSAWGEPRMVLPAVFCLLHFQMSLPNVLQLHASRRPPRRPLSSLLWWQGFWPRLQSLPPEIPPGSHIMVLFCFSGEEFLDR